MSPATDGASGDPNGDPKKPRACESCRGLKVRCEPEPSNPDGPCKRCTKAGRACLVTQPTRKRQKKTDNRVAELEKKIDALTASLQATRAPQGAGAGAGTGPAFAGAGIPIAPPIAPAIGGAPAFSYPPQSQPQAGPPTTAGLKRKFADGSSEAKNEDARDGSSSATPQPRAEQQQQPDLIDRGLLAVDQAGELFVRYTEQMTPHLPGVVFPPGTTMSDVRRSKPILFLAIMAAASWDLPTTQKHLTKELMQVIAEKVVVVGEKSLELVQTLQIATIWYWPPEHFEELKFYQLLHMAAVMAIDIGLGKKKQNRGGMRKHIPQSWRDHPMRKNPPPDPTTVEARRAWLTCYFLATNTSMALHRPNLIRWTPFMGECVDVLETSPEAAPTDKYFCHLVWTHKLAEEVGIQFSMDDPACTPNISDSRTQHALRGFERELERYSLSIPREMMQPSLRLSFHVLSLYMHEIATQSEFNDDPRQQLFPDDNLLRGGSDGLGSEAPLTPSHISALSACLTAIDGIFEVFLSLDVARIRCLPVFNFVRVAYAVVILIKMYFAASSPKSELGKVINKDNMKVEQHLERLLEKFQATAAEDKSRPAVKFLFVLVMLRQWFQKQSQNGGPPGTCSEVGPGPGSGSQPSSSQCSGGMSTDYSTTANTPLQLLSEIATNNSAAAAANASANAGGTTVADLLAASSGSNNNNNNNDNGNDNGGNSNGWISRTQQQQQQQQQINPFMLPNPHSTEAGSGPAPWLSSAFVGDFDYASLNVGDGFAQAVDLTLGGVVDGGLSMMGMETGMRYFMSEPAWFGMDGMMGTGTGGGYPF
ncbi:hypothetical protein B0T17DRAFT_492981 [Bombardia bombarda]|uniref:Zn(2)-C6 fungal-type domain-containing protein n=1 Tax=Bombardia bombarda TaxID=252184 RepID=A0AA39WZZ0_9PEZI|nr:hypothetical protein B0T17DRAFT_492981 [Bombardia bombarda]